MIIVREIPPNATQVSLLHDTPWPKVEGSVSDFALLGVPVYRLIDPRGSTSWVPNWAIHMLEEVGLVLAPVPWWAHEGAQAPLKALTELMTLTEDAALLEGALACLRVSGVAGMTSFVVDAQVEYARTKAGL